MPPLRKRDFSKEWAFKTSRSSGSGGQHVNKVNTKVELRFDVYASQCLTEEEKRKVFEKLGNKINSECELVITSDQTRSQLKNRDNVIDKFYRLLENALSPRRPRIQTKPTKTSKEKRLEKKKQHSAKKQYRKKPKL